jgi:hypothetical protein
MRYAIAAAILAILPVSAYGAPGAVPAGAAITSATPDGRGDQNAWTCRKPIQHVGPGVQTLGPMVCLKNQVWAELVRRRQTVDATGTVVPLPNTGIGGWGDVGSGVARNEPATFDAHR